MTIFNIFQADCEFIPTMDASTLSSPLMDTERTLSYLLGLHCSSQSRSTPLSTEEEENKHWLDAKFCSGGLQLLQPQNPFDEEKGESRTPSSCTTTPGKVTSRHFKPLS